MTRRKVAPENRQRGVRACRPCKLSKRRCDSAQPCGSCVRRKCPLACGYDPAGRQGPPVRPVSSHPPREPASDAATAETSATAATAATATTAATVVTAAAATVATATSPAVSAPGTDGGVLREPVASPTARMMRNAKGEKFLFGDLAGVSFLQFVRTVVLRHLGDCPFTDDKRQDVILEVDMPDNWQPLPAVPSLGRSKTLVDNFFVATAGVLDVYPKDETLRLVQNLGSLGDLKTSIGCLVLAIGAQCIVHNTDVTAAERTRFFRLGQQLAFRGLLEDISVDVVYAFLLMSFYLLGACRRNTAFLYIGVAARCAHALGLHAPEHFEPHLAPDELRQRYRAWASLRVIDLIVASVLCRPAASLAGSDAAGGGRLGHVTDIGHHHGHHHHHLAVHASAQLCAVLEDVVRHMDRRKSMAPADADAFLARLHDWSESLPPVLRRVSAAQAPLSPAAHAVAVGNLSISCQYYFAVILVTRPALLSAFLARLENSSGAAAHLAAPSTEAASAAAAAAEHRRFADAQQTRDTARLAWVCVDAAVLMADVCRDAMAAGIILDNMCMMKAWLFSAALTLGLARFVHFDQPRPRLDRAFASTIRALERLAVPSGCPQATHYVAVLKNLAAAIAAYHQHMAGLLPTRGGDARPSVRQLLVIDVTEPGGTSGLDAAVGPGYQDGPGAAQTAPAEVAPAAAPLPPPPPPPPPPPQQHSDALGGFDHISSWLSGPTCDASTTVRGCVDDDGDDGGDHDDQDMLRMQQQLPLLDETLFLENFAIVFDDL